MTDRQAEFESQLPPWTRELLACLTEREREAFVLRETGLSIAEVGDRLGVSSSCASQLVRAATGKMTAAARLASLIHQRVPAIEPHPPPTSCAAELFRVPDVLRGALDLPINSLPLLWYPQRSLQRAGIVYIGQLVQRREYELVRSRALGRKSLREVRATVAAVGLHLGMDVGDWTPPIPRAPATSREPSDAGA